MTRPSRAPGCLILARGITALALLWALVSSPAHAAPGGLVVIGGGATGPAIRQRALQLAGGADVRVLVIPHASAATNAGESSVKMWRNEGVKSVSVLDTTDTVAAVAAVRAADLIWFPGGDQKRLMDALKKLGIVEAIRERHRAGATVGGTSAGAAVMSAVMIAGDAKASDDKSGGRVPLIAGGLGLWPEAIVDQHFSQRKRQPRLRAAVRQHPQLFGVGIDEATAAVVTGREFEVVGESNIAVMSAPKPGAKKADSPLPLVETTLRPGEKFNLDTGVSAAK